MKYTLSALFRFGVVGIIGFVVDVATLMLMLSLGAGIYLGRCASYVTAATCTWWLNRGWTFRNRSGRLATQWAQFLAANAVGGAINNGIYALIMLRAPRHSLLTAILAVAVGSLSGLLVNFLLSKRFVFRSA